MTELNKLDVSRFHEKINTQPPQSPHSVQNDDIVSRLLAVTSGMLEISSYENSSTKNAEQSTLADQVDFFSGVTQYLTGFFLNAPSQQENVWPTARNLSKETALVLTKNLCKLASCVEGISQKNNLASIISLLRTADPEIKHLVDTDQHPVFSIFDSQHDFRISGENFFKGPGLALKKMYRTLSAEDRIKIKLMFDSTPKTILTELFSAKNFTNLGVNAMLQDAVKLPLIHEIGAEVQTFSETPSRLNSESLQWIKFNSPLNGSEITLLGKFDRSKAQPFMGLVHIREKQKRSLTSIVPHSKKYTLWVMNKTLGSNENFDVPFLLKNSTVSISQKINTRTLNVRNVRFDHQGQQRFDQPVTRELIIPGQEIRRWHGVHIQKNDQIKFGSLGSKEIISSGDGFITRWSGVPFDERGHVLAGSVGIRELVKPNGEIHRWLGISFAEKGEIAENTKGDKEVILPNGNTHVWEGVLFQSNFKFVPSVVGTKKIVNQNGETLTSEGVMFNENGKQIPTDNTSKSITLSTGEEYRFVRKTDWS